MGNYKFKLSELIPNAWLYKLRDMGKKNKNNNKSKKQDNSTVSPPPIKKHHAVLTPTTTTSRSPRPLPPPRRSSHYSSRPGKTVPSSSSPSDTPRKSQLRRRHRANTTSTTNVNTKSSAPNPTQLVDFSTTSGDSTATGTGSFSPEFRSDQVLLPDESLPSSWQSPYSCVSSKMSKPELDLRPIVTKPASTKPTTVRKTTTTANSPATGVRLKLRSPRISTTTRKSVSKRNVSSSSRRSRAVVKASVNPRRDFKESMEEMIMENNIRSSKELEELLACYLCLNSEEYHQVIINVFKQIWIDLNLPIHISK